MVVVTDVNHQAAVDEEISTCTFGPVDIGMSYPQCMHRDFLILLNTLHV